MKADLTIANGSQAGGDVPLTGWTHVRIGSDERCEVCIDAPGFALAPEHFQIQQRGRNIVLTDLGSGEGTLINGLPVASRQLFCGDEISAGGLRFTVSLKDESATVEPINEDSPPADRRRYRRDFEAIGAGLSRLTGAVEAMDEAQPVILDTPREGTVFSMGNSRARQTGTGESKGDADERKSSSSRILISRRFEDIPDIGSSIARSVPNAETVVRLRSALNTIYRVSSLVMSEENLDLIINTVMDVVMDVLSPERAYLLLWNEKRGGIDIGCVRGRGDAGEIGQAIGSGPSNEVVMRAITDSLALICEDVQLDPRFSASDSVQSQGIRSAMCVPVRSAAQQIGAIYVDHLSAIREFHEHELELLAAIGRQAGLAIERSRVYEDMESLFYSCVRALVTAIEAKDAYTFGHSERVAGFATAIAGEMDLDESTLTAVRLGALLHDVGKIGVPEHILTKPAALTDAEFEIIRSHPSRGADILGHIQNIPDVVAAVRWHHEKWNGFGYPDGLRTDDIPMTARIVSVADAFDAMTSHRSYRDNLTANGAIKELLRCAGDQFNPEICEIAARLVHEGKILALDEPCIRDVRIQAA